MLPFDQLNPSEQDCVRQVGLGAETRLEKHFGGVNSGTRGGAGRWSIQGPHGESIGTLTFADGTALFCPAPGARNPTCGVLGYGADGLDAALGTLHMLGFTAEATGTTVPAGTVASPAGVR